MKRRLPTQIDLVLRNIPENNPDRTQIMQKATYLWKECGCSSGAAFLCVAILALLLYVWLNFFELTMLSILTALFLVGLFTGVGKVVGIGVARFRLSLLI